jgi:Protein of unknown function (DUF1569)
MKTIFDKNTVGGLINRINTLKPDDKAQWGKMNAYQMIKHCTLTEELYLGHKSYKRLFIGKLFGKMALKGILKDDEPMKKNNPTHPEFKITDSGNLDDIRNKWIRLITLYESHSTKNVVHPFFGLMNQEQIGVYAYKHIDHHLRQFNR